MEATSTHLLAQLWPLVLIAHVHEDLTTMPGLCRLHFSKSCTHLFVWSCPTCTTHVVPS